MDKRDTLGIYIPQRISTLSDEDILTQIQELQARRESILSELSREKKAAAAKTKSGAPKKAKVQDLSKMDVDDAYTAIAAQMGISVDELKRLAATK